MAKQYDEAVVIALLIALREKSGTLNPCLKDMNALDGNRSISSFEHSLRAANKIAGELLAKKQAGQALTPADLGKSASPRTTTTPKKRRATKDDGLDTPAPKRASKATAQKSTIPNLAPSKRTSNVESDDDEDLATPKPIVKMEEGLGKAQASSQSQYSATAAAETWYAR